MKKSIIKICTYLSIITALPLFYGILFNFKALYIVSSIIFISSSLILIFFFKHTKKFLHEVNVLDQTFAILGLVIAIIAFVETSIQTQKSNEQFEANRIASKQLYDSLINEVKNLQKINSQNIKISDKLLTVSNEQLDISKTTLEDFIFERRADLIVNNTKLKIIDTLKNNIINFSINNIIFNNGRRNATKIEFRQMLIYKSLKEIGFSKYEELQFMLPNESKVLTTGFNLPIKESNDFFYWFQIIFYDSKLDKTTDRSFYYRYHKANNKFDFYYAKTNDRKVLRTFINNELYKRKLSLTQN